MAWTREVPITLSQASADRALRIMNTLMLALEARGHRVEARPASTKRQPWRKASTGVHVGDAFVQFSMFERSNMVRTEPPPKKRKHETGAEAWTRVTTSRTED